MGGNSRCLRKPVYRSGGHYGKTNGRLVLEFICVIQHSFDVLDKIRNLSDYCRTVKSAVGEDKQIIRSK